MDLSTELDVSGAIDPEFHREEPTHPVACVFTGYTLRH